MLSKKLIKYLEDNSAKFDVVEHKVVYTAYDAAQTMKVKLNEISKSLLVKFNKPFITGQKPYAIVIVGADKNIDLKKLKKVVSDVAVGLNKELRTKKTEKGKKPLLDIYNKVAKVSIPHEKELKSKLKAKPGAMTAFGTLYKLPVFVDKDFLKNKAAVFAGDSFTQSVKMVARDFHKLENAMVGKFSAPKKFKKSKVKAKPKKKSAKKKVVKKKVVKRRKK
jgi:prolyl-tRNA editing enzyme YbaK/EbsC (Cys-tRNA(Pro) deacylase)